jgi:hypothetical protein
MQHTQSYFHEKDVQTLEATSAIFRLGKKYGIDHLRDEAQRRLAAKLPTSLHSYDTLRHGERINTPRGFTVECINLARNEGLLRFLPYCFIRLNRYSISTIFNGFRLSNGKLLTLSLSDQHIYVVGLTLFRAAMVEEMFGWLVNSSCQCSSCSDARLKHAIMLLKPDLNLNQHPMTKWKESWEDGLCKSCIATAKVSYEVGRKIVWEKLPSFFGLPQWKDMLEL